MVGTVLIWLACSWQLGESEPCHQERQYFDTIEQCRTAQDRLPKDIDGLPPMLAICTVLQRH